MSALTGYETPKLDAERMLHTGLGFTSPLWSTFMVAAGAGVAYWWMAALAKGAAVPEGMALQAPPEPDAAAPALEAALMAAYVEEDAIPQAVPVAPSAEEAPAEEAPAPVKVAKARRPRKPVEA
jgi:hypothetical protein